MLAAVGWRLIGEVSRMCSLSGLMTSSWFHLNHVPLNKAPRAHLKSVWQSAELVKSMETTAEDNPAKHDRAVILRAAETHDFTVEVIKQEACKTLPGTKLCQGTPACTEASVLHIEDRRKIKTCKKHETRLLSPSKRNGFLLTPGLGIETTGETATTGTSEEWCLQAAPSELSSSPVPRVCRKEESFSMR